MITVVFVITFFYTALIIGFIVGFILVKNTNKEEKPLNKFSIVIAFRNETSNLRGILNSLKLLNYPNNLFEIILVNDQSTDDYLPIVSNFINSNSQLSIKLISCSPKKQSSKKEALTLGINTAKNNWIVTTDADCEVPKNWLLQFNSEILTNHSVFIAAPVIYSSEKTFLYHFQNLNFLSLIGSTIGSFGLKNPILCNGANLCYRKDLFLHLNGFEGNNHIASGDDMFLLEKFSRYHQNKISFIKNVKATVTTKPVIEFNKFFNQQIRWASKTKNYTKKFTKLVGLFVFLMNLIVVCFFLKLILFGGNITEFLLIFGIKSLVDFLLIFQVSKYYSKTESNWYFLPTAILYPVFIIIISIISPFKKYNWKNRIQN